MEENDDIARKLAALAATTTQYREDGARVLSRGVIPPPLQALLTEIDETVLLRKLVFRRAGTTLSLLVAGRRLLGIAETSEDIATAETTELIMVPLESGDRAQLAALTALVDRFENASGPLTVQTAETERPGSQVESGLSVQSLAQAWSVDLNAEPGSPLGTFLQICGRHLEGSLRRTPDGKIEETGSTAHGPQLKTILQSTGPALALGISGIRRGLPEARLMMCGTSADGAVQVAFAETADEAAVLVFPSGSIGSILSAWSETQG
ncbi:hypothetical protein AAD018_002870 [Aestuariibius insulae]|uniref:hypothetical protein n=1 Tax=Aestuariibius insulae TaxID=2058287 RepID=UPI00345E18FE